MAKVILYIAQSLDGFIADKDGGVGWLDNFHVEGEDYGYNEFLDTVGVIIMGANTYRQVLTFGEWPYKDKKTVVVSRNTHPVPANAGVEFYSGSLKPLIEKLKTKAKKNIWLVGGSQLVTGFLNEGLIDEIHLFIMPVLLKKGIPLFVNLSGITHLKLTSVKSYSTGVVRINYTR